MYLTEQDEKGVNDLLAGWQEDGLNMKPAYETLLAVLTGQKDVQITFHARPGVTYSVRATKGKGEGLPLFAMVDIIDDDAANRWLSVCFYNEMISDPDELGDWVPGGLLGKDAMCFDYDEVDKIKLNYIITKIAEAYGKA